MNHIKPDRLKKVSDKKRKNSLLTISFEIVEKELLKWKENKSCGYVRKNFWTSKCRLELEFESRRMIRADQLTQVVVERDATYFLFGS